MSLSIKAKLSSILFLSLSVSAFASQSINCEQLNKSGSIKENGASLSITLASNRNGSLNEEKSRVKSSGFLKDDSEFLLQVRALNESKTRAERPYATLFLSEGNDEVLDIQLQFDRRILGQEFSEETASFVIGSDDANPETSFSVGYKVLCNSYLN